MLVEADRFEADLGTMRMSYLRANEDASRVVLLLHGFGSNAAVNWQGTGWIDLLEKQGFGVLAPDQRGHGASTKFYSAEDYGPDIFATDAASLLDALGIERVNVVGFSMGARVAAWFAAHQVRRTDKLVLSGMGEHIFGGRGGNEEIARALECDDPDALDHPRAREFRTFAKRTGSDLKALAACIRPSKQQITPELIGTILAPTLVCVGTEDDTAGRGQPLVDLLPNGSLHEATGLGHHRSVGDKGVKGAIVDFLQ